MDVFDWFAVSRALDKLTVIEKPKEKKMYKQFNAGDRVRALRDVYSEETGKRSFRKGEECLLAAIGGGLGVSSVGDYIYNGKYLGFGTIDRTQHFELVSHPKKMTVAEVSKALGHTVEIVEG